MCLKRIDNTVIKMLKLRSGDELVADVTTSENVILLKDVAQIGMVAPNQMGIGPYLGHCDLSDGIAIDEDNVMFMVDLGEQIRQEYQKMFSKVITKEKGLIL